MIVSIHETLRIQADDRQWICQRRIATKQGIKGRWRSVSWHASLPQALRWVLDALLRELPEQLELGELVPVVERIARELTDTVLRTHQEQEAYSRRLVLVDKCVHKPVDEMGKTCGVNGADTL